MAVVSHFLRLIPMDGWLTILAIVIVVIKQIALFSSYGESANEWVVIEVYIQ
jgi:hypothetical protein